MTDQLGPLQLMHVLGVGCLVRPPFLQNRVYNGRQAVRDGDVGFVLPQLLHPPMELALDRESPAGSTEWWPSRLCRLRVRLNVPSDGWRPTVTAIRTST